MCSSPPAPKTCHPAADQVKSGRHSLEHCVLRRATHSVADLTALVELRDQAARWMLERGIRQWYPGEVGVPEFRRHVREAQVWLADADSSVPRPVGAFELHWSDVSTWNETGADRQAGYVHRLMTDRASAPRGLGLELLRAAEGMVAGAGRRLLRLDCVVGNPALRAYYQAAGFREMGTRRFADGARSDVVLWEKSVAGRAL